MKKYAFLLRIVTLIFLLYNCKMDSFAQKCKFIIYWIYGPHWRLLIFHTMEVNGDHLSGYQYSSKYTIIVTEIIVSKVTNMDNF